VNDWFRWDGEDLVLSLKVQPKASRDELAGPLGDALKVRITAPPVDGKANSHLVRFLAKTFGVPRGNVILESGEASRTKRIRIKKPRQVPKNLIGICS
jgi:uncharacterized protein (TIGR00251 family)